MSADYENMPEHKLTRPIKRIQKEEPEGPIKEPLHPESRVGKVIAVVSGKGGVGKSMVTELLAVAFQRRGHRTAILDADVTGPSIPKAFGITGKAMGNELGILPAVTRTGIQLISVNMFLKNDTDPVVWRGPVISGTITQFWKDVIWEDVDYMFVDMPPGTGDVPLTVFQSLPVDGIVVVTSPQEVVGMIVQKAVNMARLMDVPVLGIVENFSYLVCPDCGKKIDVFGESRAEAAGAEMGVPLLGKLPIDPELARLVDEGRIEETLCEELEDAVSQLEKL